MKNEVVHDPYFGHKCDRIIYVSGVVDSLLMDVESTFLNLGPSVLTPGDKTSG